MLNDYKRSGLVTPYITGVGVSAKTRAQLGRYTKEEYIRAAKSIASYTICFSLYEQHMAVRMMVEKLRVHRLCSFKGYGPMLKKLEAYDKTREIAEKIAMGKNEARLSVMCPIIHEDMEQNLKRMYYTAMNFYHRFKHPEAEIMAAAQMAQLVTDFTCNIIHNRVMEVRGMVPQWAPMMESLKPKLVNEQIVSIMRRIVDLTGDCGPDADINDCKELKYGIKCMEEIVSDVDQMELYTAYGIEMTEGADYLREHVPSAYYKLHPMEDPKWLAEKEARALAEMEAAERAKAEELAYTTAEVEAAEAKEGLSLEEMFAAKGWNVRRSV